MSLVTPQLESAIAAVEAAVASTGVLAGHGCIGSAARGGGESFASAAQAVDLFAVTERLRRLAAVCGVDAVTAVHTSGVHVDHGHTSATVMAKHLGRLSSGEAARVDKIRRMTIECDLLRAAWRSGELSVDQAGVLARAFANPRVRAQFIAEQQRFLAWCDQPLRVLQRRISDWLLLIDQDGPEPRPEPAHENRDVKLVQDHFAKSWHLQGVFGSLQGDKLQRIFAAYLEAETLTDWEHARDIHGADTCADLLPRTAAQRRADALEQIFADAAHNPNKSVAVDTVHNIVWSAESHEEMLRRYCGAKPEPINIDTHKCHNLDGHSLDPGTAFADFLTAKWRRVVQDAAGITIDISKTQRFFTGLARLGVQLSFDTCFWPGCDVPVTACQIDHTRPAARGGLTTQSNGGPACEKHNRHKERGYTVTRQPDGSFQITTPKGHTLPH